MKKVLLISDLFYPENIIGALRPTKIAKALTARGWQVDVFTRYRVDQAEVQDRGICHRVYGFQDRPQPELQPESPGFLGRVKQNIRQDHPALFAKLKKWNDYTFFKGTVREAAEMEQQLLALLDQEPEFSRYDAVFSTFGPISSVVCGLAYHRRNPQVRWVCDFRDPMLCKHLPRTLWRKFSTCEQQACEQADAIVAVSSGYLERICRGRWTEKAYMIPNGYDLRDFVPAENARKSDSCFTITYVGALYGGDRDLTPLFRAIRELVEEKVIKPGTLSIAYAGDEADTFYAQAKKHQVEDLVVNHGILARKACLDLQFSSHMLVLSTWNSKTDYGVFPGKLLEYMLIGCPILSLTCGPLPDGEVTRVIREGQLGIAYEQARDSQDYPALRQYLKTAYLQWQDQGTVPFQPVQQVLDRYNYENIIGRIEALLQG